MDTKEARRILADDDPARHARAAGLRYVAEAEPGYVRLRRGRGFTYRDLRGQTLRSPRLRARFDALAIPPAWSDVWICRSSDGHLQAFGRDEAGRKQFRYHARWEEVRGRYRYERVVAFGRLLRLIRARVGEDLGREGLDRRRVLAAVVALLDVTRARIGNGEYARLHGTYGLTTIRKKHVVRENGDEVLLEFPGKSGTPWSVEVERSELVEVIVECLETPGYELFKYVDDGGSTRDVTSADVNAYLRDATGANVGAKDFRTWAGTVEAAVARADLARERPDVGIQKRIVECVARVAERLGNTPAVCRSAYIHPWFLDEDEAREVAILEALDGCERDVGGDGLDAVEKRVLSLLERSGAAA